MLSLRGRCHTFDLNSDGYCRGEGCVTARCIPGVDNILEDVGIFNFVVQQDGCSSSLTAPNSRSQ